MSSIPPTLTFAEESAGDVAAIEQLTVNAFDRPDEAGLVAQLRKNGGLTFSAVALVDGEVIAHAGFSPVTVGGALDAPAVLALAPVAVDPPHQRKGHGSSLLRWSLDHLREAGCPAVIVLGEPEFYGRFGFRPASEFGIRCPYDVPAPYFMVLELQHEALVARSGIVGYRPEFASLG